jgi:outer membrane protein TolC
VARLAAANCKEAQALLLDAGAVRHQTAVDTGWRNPQLRPGWHWGDEDEQVMDGNRSTSREWDERDFGGYTAALRVYTANPFVNRWLRRRGGAEAQAKEAESKEVAFAVFSEVCSLCLEAEVLREEIGVLEQMAGLREQACAIRREQAEAGVVSALEQIRSETRLESLRSEIREKEVRRQQYVRRIAVLAGLPAEQVRLRPPAYGRRIPEARLDAAVLTDLAFLRRPDLARVRSEHEAARHGVEAAKAAQIPWLEYVEATYEQESADTDSSGRSLSAREGSEQEETEWQVRAAVTLPVFNWLGDEVRLSRAELAAAELREQGLLDSVRREVCGVLEDYRLARAQSERDSGGRAKLLAGLTARIDALAGEPTVPREEVLAAREELLELRRTCMKAERERLRLAQYLETVSGGPLTEGQ